MRGTREIQQVKSDNTGSPDKPLVTRTTTKAVSADTNEIARHQRNTAGNGQ